RYYHLLDSLQADGAGHRHLMDGTQLAPGGVARRPLAPAAELKPEILKALRARATFERLCETPAGKLIDPSRTLSQIGSVLCNLPGERPRAAALAIPRRYADQGQWTLAQEAFLLMVDKYPAHPLAADAYRWLIRHNCSSEARRRYELGQFLLATKSNVRLL